MLAGAMARSTAKGTHSRQTKAKASRGVNKLSQRTKKWL